MKRIRWSLAVCSLLFGLMSPGISEAKSISTDKEKVEKLNQLESKYNFELVNLSENVDTVNKELLKFDSVEEFEQFIKNVNQSESKDIFEMEVPVKQDATILDNSINDNVTTLATYDDIGHIQWWAPFTGWGWTGIACWKNIDFEYEYSFSNGNPYFTSVDDSSIDSDLSGVTVAITWNQVNEDADIITEVNYHDTARITVDGYYVLGVDIKGFEVGAKIHDEWEGSLRLVN